MLCALVLSTLAGCGDGLSPTVDSPDATAPVEIGPCSENYVRGFFFPREAVYCQPSEGYTPKPSDMPCSNGQIVGWFDSGVVRCAP